MVRGTALALVLLASPLGARAEQVAGRVVAVSGNVLITHPGNAELGLALGADVHDGDQLRTTSGRVRLLMRDKGVLDLGPHTHLVIKTYGLAPAEKKRSVSLQLFVGRLWARVTKSLTGDRDYNIETPNAVAGVRGTELVVDQPETGETAVTVVSGSVEVGTSGAEPMLLGAMQRGTVTAAGVVVSTVTQAEVAQLARETHVGVGSSNAGEPAQSGQAVGAEAGENAGEAPGAEDASPEAGGELPPVELDPGAGAARVRGHFEVRE